MLLLVTMSGFACTIRSYSSYSWALGDTCVKALIESTIQLMIINWVSILANRCYKHVPCATAGFTMLSYSSQKKNTSIVRVVED